MLKKRLLFLSLIISLLINGPIFAQENFDVQINQETQIKSKAIDERARILQEYLSQYNSPLQYQAQDFIEAADQYDLDWKLVVSIAGTESTFGKFIPGGYNAWGWGVYGNQALYFDSWRDGIFTVSEGLRKNYINKGYKDPYSMNRIYAASPTWGAHVSYFLTDIEKYNQKYQQNQKLAANFSFPVAGSSATISLP